MYVESIETGSVRKLDTSLFAFTVWLEQQNPETTYEYVNNDSCVFAQFLRAQGVKNPHVTSARWYDGNTLGSPPLDLKLVSALYETPVVDDSVDTKLAMRTFGALLKHLEST